MSRPGPHFQPLLPPPHVLQLMRTVRQAGEDLQGHLRARDAESPWPDPPEHERALLATIMRARADLQDHFRARAVESPWPDPPERELAEPAPEPDHEPQDGVDGPGDEPIDRATEISPPGDHFAESERAADVAAEGAGENEPVPEPGPDVVPPLEPNGVPPFRASQMLARLSRHRGPARDVWEWGPPLPSANLNSAGWV